MSVEDLYRDIQRQKNTARTSASAIMGSPSKSAVDLAYNMIESYGANKPTEAEGLIEADGLVQRLDSSLSRLLIDPVTDQKKLYNNEELTGVLERGRAEANKYMNMSPKSTQYIESAYQRWSESLNKQMDKNSKMYVIKNRFNQMHSDDGKIDEIENIFRGLSEGDISVPYIDAGKDGKISRSEAFEKISSITNYLENNKEFITEMGEHPYYGEIANQYEDASGLAHFFTAQLIGLDEKSDTPLLTEGERDALNKYSIDGDIQPLIELAKSMKTQTDKYEEGVEDSMVAALDEYNKMNEILNSQEEDITNTIDNFNPEAYDSDAKREAALKEIKLNIGIGKDAELPISLYDLQIKQDKLVKSIKSFDKEYSRYNLEGKPFSESPEGIKYRNIFEYLDIKSNNEDGIPIKERSASVSKPTSKQDIRDNIEEVIGINLPSKEGVGKDIAPEEGTKSKIADIVGETSKDTIDEILTEVTGSNLSELETDINAVKQQNEIVSKVMDLSPSKGAPNYPNTKELNAIVNEYNLSKAQKSQLNNMFRWKDDEKQLNVRVSKFMDSVKNPIAEKRIKRLVDRAVEGNFSKKDEAILASLDEKMLGMFNRTIESYKKHPSKQKSYLRGLSLKSKLIDIIKESL
tara:strand:+ start:1657 stop:3558 length:1902 start_codon:yes stop_codon:yes gene_type:complete